MPRILPNASELADSPELAILHALDATLVATEVALVAVYPELEDADFLADDPPSLTAHACVADDLLTLVAALKCAVARYAALLRGRRARHLVRIDGDF